MGPSSSLELDLDLEMFLDLEIFVESMVGTVVGSR